MTIRENEWYIEAPWGRLCIVAWGHCFKPPVLVCHGMMDSIVSFRSLIKQLPQDFYYIGVELPGNGKSDPFPPGLLMNFYDLVYCVEVVAKHFRWQTFAYLGHSAGAYVGLLYDFCLPGKISRLILLDPIPRPMDPEDFPKWYKGSYQALFDDFDYYNNQKEKRRVYTREEALKKLLKIDGVSTELALEHLARLTEDVGRGRVRFTADQRYNLVPATPFTADQLRALWVHSKAQILVFATSHSLRLGKYSRCQFVLEDTTSRRARLVDTHHNVHLSAPDTVVTAVAQFLLHGVAGLDAKAKL